MTPGRLLYRLYYEPVARLARMFREGGPLEQHRTRSGRREMEAAARNLPGLTVTAPGTPLPLHLLTGDRFWYQTAFCLYSFACYSRTALAPVLYDDGSLQPAQRECLQRVFPAAVFVSQSEALARLDRHLPRHDFPALRERWDHYPNLRKLIDPHLGSTGWKLVMDSDLLFFRRPALLIDWLRAPDRPLHAVDVDDSYGYSPDLLRRVAGQSLPARLNVGLCGLNSAELDWKWLERTCAGLIAAEGTHYYLEQALVALLLAGRSCVIAPAADYVTLPTAPEVNDCGAVMHHYVAASKNSYFQRNWRRIPLHPPAP